MRRPVFIASILALLSACDKPQERPLPDVPAAPRTAVSPTSTVLFQVYGSKDEPRLVPIAIADGGHLAPLNLDAEGWRVLDSMFFAKGAKLPIYRNGAETGTVEVMRGMWSDEGELYSLPGCRLLLPQAVGKLAAKGFVEGRAVEARLTALGMDLVETLEVPHDTAALAAALGRAEGEMLLILTGSATSDLHDTAPDGLRQAGGRVTRFGMPVDPGNLLFLGELGQRPVIGLPGCARSPALNGADWVLERLACGLDVGDDEIAAMGVGGLLKEIPIRPQAREPKDKSRG